MSSSGISQDYSALFLRVESGVTSVSGSILRVKVQCGRLGSSEDSVSVSASVSILRCSFEEASVQFSASERADLRHWFSVASCSLTFAIGCRSYL